MSRILRAVSILALAGALIAVSAAPAAARPDLAVTSFSQPPESVLPGRSFNLSFTADNQGSRSVRRRTIVHAYLSSSPNLRLTGRRGFLPRRVRVRRVGRSRIRRLRPGRSTTKRMGIRIPRATPEGDFHLVLCADATRRVRERSERGNCHATESRIRIGTAPTGPAGPPGPAGGADTLRITRKTLPLGSFTNEGPGPRVGDNEGSTQQFDLLEVGGVKIRGLCRSTTNGDLEDPADDDDGDGFLGVDNDFDTDEDGDEAKILLYLDRPDGNFSFSGPHGKRFNVNAGFGNTTTSVEDAAGDTGGEGKHMAISTAADPESRIAGDADDTDPSVGEDTTAPAFEPEDDWEHAFRSGSVYVATSTGTEFILNAYVGVGVLGAPADQCVFGGSVTVVNR